MSIFDERTRRYGKGCPVCGSKATLQVQVQAKKLGERGSANGGASVSKAVSMCPEHGEPLYRALRARIDDEATR